MKNKIVSFFTSLIIIGLLGMVIFIGVILFSDFISEDTIEVAHSSNTTSSIEKSNDTEKIKKKVDVGSILAEVFNPNTNEEKIEYSEQNSNGNFFYEQLTEVQKRIYNGLQENKENMRSGKYVVKYGSKFTDVLEKENGTKALQADYQTAVEAYVHDNMDLFYLDISKLYLNIETEKRVWDTKYNVYISPEEGGTYYNSDFKSEEEVLNAINKIENVKNTILKNLGKDSQKNIKIIHDYLVDNIEYDDTYNDKGTYNIYGALVQKRCVCDGYARAFKYLANSAGIECELIQGKATNTNGKTETHAWNAVKLNNVWYYIDTTWDDPIIIGSGIVSNLYHYRYYLKGTSTFEKDHISSGQFSDGGKTFSYPEVSSKDY